MENLEYCSNCESHEVFLGNGDCSYCGKRNRIDVDTVVNTDAAIVIKGIADLVAFLTAVSACDHNAIQVIDDETREQFCISYLGKKE